MKPLSILETQDAEKTTTPVLNFYNKVDIESCRSKLSQEIQRMFEWYEESKLDTNKSRKEFLIKKLGKPSYHVTYEFREAVWGFNVNDRLVVIYYSLKGFSVQVSEEASAKETTEILEIIHNHLNKK